jgi:hypothetical protein
MVDELIKILDDFQDAINTPITTSEPRLENPAKGAS